MLRQRFIKKQNKENKKANDSKPCFHPLSHEWKMHHFFINRGRYDLQLHIINMYIRKAKYKTTAVGVGMLSYDTMLMAVMMITQMTADNKERIHRSVSFI